MTLFALSLLDPDLSNTVFNIVRVIASVGGAVIGWFAADPLTRGVYRVSKGGATPGTLLLGAKLSGAAALAAVVYFSISFGTGRGPGFGPGSGGLPGSGKGEGGDKVIANANPKNEQNPKNAKTPNDPKTPPKLEIVEIEILGGNRLKDAKDKHYYLVKGLANPFDDEGLKAYFQKNLGKIKIVPVLTDGTTGLARPNDALAKLEKLADDCKIERVPHKSPMPD